MSPKAAPITATTNRLVDIQNTSMANTITTNNNLDKA